MNMKRSCNDCKALALKSDMRTACCYLGFETEEYGDIGQIKPLTLCPKPKTKKGFHDLLQFNRIYYPHYISDHIEDLTLRSKTVVVCEECDRILEMGDDIHVGEEYHSVSLKCGGGCPERPEKTSAIGSCWKCGKVSLIERNDGPFYYEMEMCCEVGIC